MTLDALSTLATVAGALIGAMSLGIAVAAFTTKTLKRDTNEERKRLRSIIMGPDAEPSVINVNGDLHVAPDAPLSGSTRAGEQRVDDDRFAELLIEYYAWGLTQARRSTALSLSCSALGVAVLLSGVVLAIWKAETTGDLYVSAVAGVAGLVSTIIGQLAHRRADTAMGHMQRQTSDLRQDMKRERETETAIRLAGEVVDIELKAQLQAALVLKLSGGSLSDVREGRSVPLSKVPPQDSSRNGATV